VAGGVVVGVGEYVSSGVGRWGGGFGWWFGGGLFGGGLIGLGSGGG